MTKLLRAGGLAFDIAADIFGLWGRITTSGNVCHFRKAASTAGYQVTAGKTLYIAKLRVFPSGETTIEISFCAKIGYADNDVGLNTTTARTNPVMAIGTDSLTADGMGFLMDEQVSPQAADDLEYTVEAIIPIAAAGKFPFLRAIKNVAGAVNFEVWAFEL